MVFANAIVASTPELPFGGIKDVGLRPRALHLRHARVHQRQVVLRGVSRYYFDHAASAPRRDEVVEAMAPWTQRGRRATPRGAHRAAREARRAVEEAREEVAAFVGARPGERRLHRRRDRVVPPRRWSGVAWRTAGPTTRRPSWCRASSTTRCSTPRRWLERFTDVSVRYVGVDADGVVDLDELAECARRALRRGERDDRQQRDRGLPAGRRGELDRRGPRARRRAPCTPTPSPPRRGSHLPTVTATASTSCRSARTRSAGRSTPARWSCARDVALDPVIPGGGQERGRRGGTVDVAAAVGLAAAARATAARPRRAPTSAPRSSPPASSGRSPWCRARASPPRERRACPARCHVTFEGVASDELLFLVDQDGALRVGGGELLERRAGGEPRARRDGRGARARARRAAAVDRAPRPPRPTSTRAVAIVAAAVHRLRGDG